MDGNPRSMKMVHGNSHFRFVFVGQKHWIPAVVCAKLGKGSRGGHVFYQILGAYIKMSMIYII